jgi:hypothetical protein
MWVLAGCLLLSTEGMPLERWPLLELEHLAVLTREILLRVP